MSQLAFLKGKWPRSWVTAPPGTAGHTALNGADSPEAAPCLATGLTPYCELHWHLYARRIAGQHPIH